jgi:hypothetical protein
MDSKNKKVASL